MKRSPSPLFVTLPFILTIFFPPMCRSCSWLHSDWSCLRAWQKIFHWNKALVQSLDLYFMRLKYHRNPLRQRRGSPFCAGFIQNDPLSTNQLADDRQWWKFDSLKLEWPLKCVKFLYGKESALGSPQSWVAGACMLGGSSVFCRRLPIACLLIPRRIGPVPW